MFAAVALVLATQPAYPSTVVTGEKIAFTATLPDAERGFYRGTRFDHAGVISHLKVNGHTLFGPWKSGHDPANNDDITGPCEEFGMDGPLGYAEAKVGETFLKIGVGELVKPKEDAYHFQHQYRIAKPGTWTTEVHPSGVRYAQTVTTAAGYGYEYVKRVEGMPGKAGFRIDHTLVNRGTKRITTTVYNHNFFNVDGDTVGPNYAIEFPHAVAAEKPVERFAELVRLDHRRLTLTGVLDKGSVYAGLTGWPAGSDYQFTMTHKPSGIKMCVTGAGAPVAKFNVWAVGGGLCPEPFVALDIAPGAAAAWRAEYVFDSGERGASVP